MGGDCARLRGHVDARRARAGCTSEDAPRRRFRGWAAWSPAPCSGRCCRRRWWQRPRRDSASAAARVRAEEAQPRLHAPKARRCGAAQRVRALRAQLRSNNELCKTQKRQHQSHAAPSFQPARRPQQPQLTGAPARRGARRRGERAPPRALCSTSRACWGLCRKARSESWLQGRRAAVTWRERGSRCASSRALWRSNVRRQTRPARDDENSK